MSTPIKREDIRKGDRVRRTHVEEFTADYDAAGDRTGADFGTYELIERPVALPTEPGYYHSGREFGSAGTLQLTRNGEWFWVGNNYRPNPEPIGAESLSWHAGKGGLRLLRPAPEVAADVLADLEERSESGGTSLAEDFAAAAIKFGVTK